MIDIDVHIDYKPSKVSKDEPWLWQEKPSHRPTQLFSNIIVTAFIRSVRSCFPIRMHLPDNTRSRQKRHS